MSQNNRDNLKVTGSGAYLVESVERRNFKTIVQLREGVPEYAVSVSVHGDDATGFEIEVVELDETRSGAAQNSIWAPWD